MAADYRIPVFPKDHRDFAWKWVIMEKPLEFLLFLLPYLVTMKDPSRDIKADAQVIVPLVGAQTDKYSRFADVVFEIPVENEDFDIIFIVEQQRKKDHNMGLRVFDLYTRYRAKRPNEKIVFLVLYTGPENKDNVCSFSESFESTKITLKFGTFYLPDIDLESLKNDSRFFAPIMYIARLELEDKKKNLESRAEYAKKILNYINEFDLTAEDKHYFLFFAFYLFKLYEDGIDQTVKEEYIKMAFLPVAEAKFEWLKRVVREEGRDEGREEAREENRRATMEMAKKMLADNLPFSSVVRYTGLTEEEVVSLQNNVSPDLS